MNVFAYVCLGHMCLFPVCFFEYVGVYCFVLCVCFILFLVLVFFSVDVCFGVCVCVFLCDACVCIF